MNQKFDEFQNLIFELSGVHADIEAALLKNHPDALDAMDLRTLERVMNELYQLKHKYLEED